MTVDDDKKTSDNIKVPKFDHSNKTVSRDARIKGVYTEFQVRSSGKVWFEGWVSLSSPCDHEN